MKILALAASLRKESYNRKLMLRAVELARSSGAEVTPVDLKEFEMPYYDGDLELASGIPLAARRLAELVRSHDALLIASPEYNASIPGHFKNTFDWVSRVRPIPFTKKPTLLMTASPGYYGGIRAHGQLRIPFDTVGAFVYPRIPAIADSANAFDPQGKLTDPDDAAMLESTVKDFVSWAGRLRSGPEA